MATIRAFLRKLFPPRLTEADKARLLKAEQKRQRKRERR